MAGFGENGIMKAGADPDPELSLETSEEEAKRLGRDQKQDLELAPLEATERPSGADDPQVEQLRSNVEGNINSLTASAERLSAVPASVLESPEGQEAAQSLREKMGTRMKDFGRGLIEKIDKWNKKDKAAIYATAAAGALMVGPALIQYARTKFPEVGMALDAAPEAFQQLIHLDLYVDAVNLFRDEQEQIDTIWRAGTAEENNLFADIASGKVEISSLPLEQKEMLVSSTGSTINLIESLATGGQQETAETLARGTSMGPTLIKGMANASLFGAAAMSTGLLYTKLRKMVKGY